MALAGGINLVLTTTSSEMLQAAGLLSNACKSFDASANGYCRSEACGMVVLKRLNTVAPGERVYAVIRGSAVNHGGKGHGLGVPDAMAQEAVLRAAYEDAKLDPKKVRAVIYGILLLLVTLSFYLTGSQFVVECR